MDTHVIVISVKDSDKSEEIFQRIQKDYGDDALIYSAIREVAEEVLSFLTGMARGRFDPAIHKEPTRTYSISDVVSPTADRVTNRKGGSQSHAPVRFDLIDGLALFAMASVLYEGAVKYGEDNWRKIDVPDHLNHLIMHAYAYLSGDRTDEHLSHAMCRAMFAQAVAIEQGGER